MDGSQEVKAADGPHTGTITASFTTPVASTTSRTTQLVGMSSYSTTAYLAHRLVLNHRKNVSDAFVVNVNFATQKQQRC